MGSRMELLELALHLKQERLFINSERQYLQTLNEKVLKTVEKLYHVAWIAREQRINLDGLILSKPDSSPALCCERANNLESINFIDAYKQLGFQESLYGDFLRQLRSNPKLVAMCLVATEKIKTDLMHHMVNVIMASVYGHCILQDDENYVLQLLRHLMELQLATSENPRRLLRHGSCAFSRVYKNFNEGLFSTKLFLTAALHDPIMQLLMEDELFLDIDPSKAVIRFPPLERFRRFGKEGTQEYVANLQRYRNWTITKLVNLTYRFIAGIKGNMFCFPPNLVWLVKQLYNIVMKAKKVEVREVGAMCIDLIFSFFICPAIVNPEPHGIISDTPISYIARFNLMQVAQILHVLAMSKWEEIEPKLMDVYGRFDKECMSSLLDVILEGSVEDEPPDFGSRLQHLSRSAMLVSEYDLMALIATLRTICNDPENEELDKKPLEQLLADIPALPPNTGQNATYSDVVSNDVSPQTPGTKRNLLGKGKNKSKQRLTPGTQDQNEDKYKVDSDDTNPASSNFEDILVISLNNPLNECPGMLSEQKVLLSMEQQNRHSKVRLKLENLTIEDGTQEKRTRFSLSHDQDSVGTSDNLEAISEAASNHSVSSSLELENENDNLSDMVSANVSGRGTPNVSGRDTPSSQTEGEGSEERPLNLPVTNQKQNQEDIDDRFGKFDIKPLIEGDETISLVSDTWSTDVLASDSEMMGEPQVERPLDDVSIPNTVYLDPHQPLFGLSHLNTLDMVDTASEAWSTDVLASDSERMQEVDTDDTGSVTRSDDAASVARSDDITRFEGDLDHQMDGSVPLSLTDHSTDENITPRASGSRSPIDGAPCKQNHCNAVNAHVVLPKSKGHVIGAENAMESLGILTAKMHTDLIHQDLHNLIDDDETVLFRQNHSPNDLGETDTDLPNDAGDGFAGSKNKYPKQDKESRIMSEAWSSRDSHDPNDMTGMQTLGRLSIAMGELPDNGILPIDSSVFAAAATNTTDTLSAIEATSLEKAEDSTISAVKNGVENENAPHEEKKGESMDERKARTDEKEVFSGVRLSTGSLTSSVSSSSSGSGPGDATVKSDLSASHDASATLTVSGTIPKSISFDKTAEKGDKEMENEDHKQKKGFFKNLKGFVKGRARKSSRGHDEMGIRNYDRASASDVFRDDGSLAPTHRNLRRTVGDDPKTDIEEILAKYRKKPTCLLEGEGTLSVPCSDSAATNASDKDKESVISGSEDERQIASSTFSEASYAFIDAKRKVRLVLSSADISAALWGDNNPFLLHYQDNDKQLDNELVAFLKMQLAEAVNLQDKSLVAQLHETLRCVGLLDKESSKKLFRSLREDYKKRTPYISYLVRSRQGLLTTLAHLERILDRIERDKVTCNKFMISVCVRLFLEKRERMIQRFVDEFQRLTVSDEKTDLVEKFLQHLYKDMETDALWQAASEQQMEQAQIAIERNIMSQLYIYALYPNGDGDVMRDKLIFEHIQKLSKVIMPNHRYLRIPKIYQYECPWPAAQAEIGTINAYKTPRDKLQCILRCCNTIMNLLRLANEKVIPAADDFMPVLVYVVIQANPLNLLSNIQYVNSFYQKRIEGEDEYWWTQFCSAVEFIKTMDYNN